MLKVSLYFYSACIAVEIVQSKANRIKLNDTYLGKSMGLTSKLVIHYWSKFTFKHELDLSC